MEVTGICDKCGGPEPCSKRACIGAWSVEADYWNEESEEAARSGRYRAPVPPMPPKETAE